MEDGGLEDGSAGNACGPGVWALGLRLARDSAWGVARGTEPRPVRAVVLRPARVLPREPDWVVCRAVGWSRRALYRIKAGAEKQATRNREQGNGGTRKRS
jgi:hypothetical protein